VTVRRRLPATGASAGAAVSAVRVGAIDCRHPHESVRMLGTRPRSIGGGRARRTLLATLRKQDATEVDENESGQLPIWRSVAYYRLVD